MNTESKPTDNLPPSYADLLAQSTNQSFRDAARAVRMPCQFCGSPDGSKIHVCSKPDFSAIIVHLGAQLRTALKERDEFCKSWERGSELYAAANAEIAEQKHRAALVVGLVFDGLLSIAIVVLGVLLFFKS